MLRGGDAVTPDLLADRYELVKELGRGAMGVVHLAHDRVLDDTDIAIKILPKELETDPRALVRLKREAMTAMKITHSNVMRLINFEESNGTRFLVMEYIDGPDLLHVIADAPGGKLDVGTFLRYADGICTGVDYAHRQNVVHSDLKPSNIMLDANGDIKITDFGVAQVVRETITRVSRVETAGTLIYMSPELHDGERNTKESDQYALGITFYEMLTAEPPFTRGNITHQHQTKTVPPIPDVPDRINDAIQKALAKKPEDRWESVKDFGKALSGEIEIPTETDWREAKTETWSERDTITVKPKTNAAQPEPDAPPAQQKKSPIGLIAAALGVLLLVSGGAWWFMQPTEYGSLFISTVPSGATVYLDGDSVGTTPLDIQRIEADDYELGLALSTYSDMIREISVPANMLYKLENLPMQRETARLIVRTDPPQAEVWLDNTRLDGTTPLSLDSILTGRHVVKLIKPDHVEFERPVRVVAPLTDLSFTLEPGAVFFREHWVRTTYRDSVLRAEQIASLKSQIESALSNRAWDTAETLITRLRPLETRDIPGYEQRIAQGRQEDHNAGVADLRRQINTAISAHNYTGATQIAARLQQLEPSAGAEALQTIQNARQQRINELPGIIRAAWRAGNTEQRNTALQQLRELDPDNTAVTQFQYMPGECIRTLRGHSNYVRSVAVAGNRIVSGSDDNTVRIWDIHSGRLVRTLVGHSYGVRSVTIAEDKIVSGAAYRDNTVKVWDVNTGRLIRTLRGHSYDVNSFAIVGNRVISGSGDNTIMVWDLNSGRHIRTLTGHSGDVYSVVVAHDNIISRSYQEIKMWDINTGHLLRTFAGHSSAIRSITVTGSRIVSGLWQQIKVWDINSGELRRTIAGHSQWVNSVVVIDDKIVSGSEDNTIKIWDINSGELLQTLTGHTNDVSSVAIAGNRIISGSADHTIKIWRAPWE